MTCTTDFFLPCYNVMILKEVNCLETCMKCQWQKFYFFKVQRKELKYFCSFQINILQYVWLAQKKKKPNLLAIYWFCSLKPSRLRWPLSFSACGNLSRVQLHLCRIYHLFFSKLPYSSHPKFLCYYGKINLKDYVSVVGATRTEVTVENICFAAKRVDRKQDVTSPVNDPEQPQQSRSPRRVTL